MKKFLLFFLVIMGIAASAAAQTEIPAGITPYCVKGQTIVWNRYTFDSMLKAGYKNALHVKPNAKRLVVLEMLRKEGFLTKVKVSFPAAVIMGYATNDGSTIDVIKNSSGGVDVKYLDEWKRMSAAIPGGEDVYCMSDILRQEWYKWSDGLLPDGTPTYTFVYRSFWKTVGFDPCGNVTEGMIVHQEQQFRVPISETKVYKIPDISVYIEDTGTPASVTEVPFGRHIVGGTGTYTLQTTKESQDLGYFQIGFKIVTCKRSFCPGAPPVCPPPPPVVCPGPPPVAPLPPPAGPPSSPPNNDEIRPPHRGG
jgi:hypothetical protein